MNCERGEDAPAKPMGISEIQEQRHREGVAIVRALREKAGWCHNNNGHKTFEDWEAMDKWLLEIADRLEYGLGYRRTEEDEEVSKNHLSFLLSAYEDSKKLMEFLRLTKKLEETMQKPEIQSLIDKIERMKGKES